MTRAAPPIALWLDAVIVAVTDEVPRVLTVRRDERLDDPSAPPEAAEDALPFGPLEPDIDRTLELGLRRWVREQTGIELGYVEQLYTFGDRYRNPEERHGGPRAVSAAALALVRERAPVGQARWLDAYAAFPWEDWRIGRPAMIDGVIRPAIDAWAQRSADAAERAVRRERADIAFGLWRSDWDDERVLARYELLWEVGLVREASRDAALRDGAVDAWAAPESLGRSMALDHRRILATALGRLRGKLKYRPVVFELLPPSFTLTQLQRTVEALSGMPLHAGNLRRLVERGGLVEPTGAVDARTGGRPAALFRFRREVLRERRAPGVGLLGGRG